MIDAAQTIRRIVGHARALDAAKANPFQNRFSGVLVVEGCQDPATARKPFCNGTTQKCNGFLKQPRPAPDPHE